MRIMSIRCGAIWVALILGIFGIGMSAMAVGPRIGVARADNLAVGRFSRFNLSLQVDGGWNNPFDPSQADVSVEFVSPSGHKLRVPAFYTQDFNQVNRTPQEERKSVKFVKFFIEEKGWHGASDVDFFFDDVTLVNSQTGSRRTLDDMEGGDVRRWGSEGTAWATDIVHNGSRSLRFSPRITDVEHWPGVVTAINGGDWSQYDGLVLWVYPRYTGTPGTLSLYYSNDKDENSPIDTLSVGASGLTPNHWNRVVWSWRDFPSSQEFQKQGTPHWRVRFAPTEVGVYHFRVLARDASGSSEGNESSFRCVASASPGFVRISKKDPRFFVRDDGKPFFTIGHDVSWDLRWVLRAFPKMSANGENATYCILVPWENSIEWGELGRYDLQRAAYVDALIDAATANGIYLKLSFDVHDALRRGAAWDDNPYSAKRGGPCQGPNDFYEDPRARELYKRRLRYMVARWGYSPNVMAWETVAEIDGGTEMPDGSAGWGYPNRPGGSVVSEMLSKWLREIHSYLRSEDPYGRLLSVSFGGDVSDPQIWRMPEIQYVQLHHYDSLNPGQSMPDWCRRLTGFGKPFLITESGWWADWNKPVHDPGGICQHDGIWASSLGGASGSSFSWWWEQIDALNLYPQYQVLHRFLDGVNWPDERFHSAQATSEISRPGHFGPMTLTAAAPFGDESLTRIEVDKGRRVIDSRQVPQFLLSPDRRKIPGPTFVVDCPEAGEFRIHLDTVCIDSRVEVKLDGKVVLARDLPVRDVAGKTSKFDDKWKVWNCQYNEDIVVALSAGHHEVLIENTAPGGSWIRISSYTLTRYVPPSLNIVGITGATTTLLWIQNAWSTWWNLQEGQIDAPIVGASLNLGGLPIGQYSVDWWDTHSGRVIQYSVNQTKSGGLRLQIPLVSHDLACKIRLKSHVPNQ